MPDVSINPKNHTSHDGDDFVGMKFVTDGSVEAIFPLGYHHPDKDKKDELKKELYALLCTIKRHSENKEGDLDRTKTNTDKNKFPFDAYITVIRDFMQYGYYIEREVKYKRSPLGKINWKRTIAQVRPIIQDDGSPIYTDFVIRQNAKKTDNLISLIHEWCVYEAFTAFGWLFTTFDPHKPTLKIGEDKNYFISVIRDSLKSTFIDRNRALFKAMIAMLNYGGVDGKEVFFYGTKHFQTVWEGLIDTSYGNLGDEKKDFFPGTEWCFCGVDKPVSANKLRPDTIMQYDDGDDGGLFVLDAKYYSFTKVPAASDINKQVAYGKYAEQKVNHEKAENQKKTKVYNAFLIPYDFKRERGELKDNEEYPYIYIGYARFVRKKTPKEKLPTEQSYELVLGILIDTKWLIENAGRIDKKDLADFIKKSYEKAKSHNNKAE